MSLPTTPARSIARSTLSTPSTAQDGGSPQELTPKSKVKAMLAAFDDDFEFKPFLEPKKPGRSALSAVDGNIQRLDQKKGVKEDAAVGQREDVEEEEEEGDASDESPIVPRGSLAARLNGQTSNTRRSSSSSGGDRDADAYARIKKQLLQGPVTKTHESTGATESREASPVERPSKRRRTSSIGSDRSDSRASSPTRNRNPSPGLFVTPEAVSMQQRSPRHSVDSDCSDSDLPPNPQSNSRFLELVAKKRAEREAKQAAENESKAAKAARQRSFEKALLQDASSGSGFSDDDREADRRLTQYSRPTRKASKKALEEMNRETQRMSRNMQLAHQAKTKKTISKQSLLDRFNYRTSMTPIVEVPQNPSSSTAASSAPASDLEDVLNKDSPPTSPVVPEDPFLAPADLVLEKQPADTTDTMQPSEQEDEELPTMLEVMSQPIQKMDKGKWKAIDKIEVDNAPRIARGQKTVFKQRPIKVRLPKPMSDRGDVDLDSGSDLEVLPVRKSKASKLDVFKRLPVGKVQEGRSMQTLRALAHLNSPEKMSRAKNSSMTQADMQMSLQQRARRQAMEERRAKIEDLKRRGIIVQTAEEREKDQAEVEDLVDKARREADEIMQKEKKAAKKEKIANGEVDGLADSSDEDDDYQADVNNSDIELSGSGEEEPEKASGEEDLSSDGEQLDDDEDRGVDLVEDNETAGLIDNEASEDSQDEEDDESTIEDGNEDDEETHEPHVHRRRTKMVIDDDDDDDDEEKVEPSASAQHASSAPEIPQFPALAEPTSTTSPMGMTQAFAATMADTQTQGFDEDYEQDSLALLGPPPEPSFPMFDETDSLQVVEDSQNGLPLNTNVEQNTDSSKEIDLHFTQSQIRYDTLDDTQGRVVASQISEMPDPTQDVGFILSSPAPERFVSDPPSTVDTVLRGVAGDDSPIKKKRGRLQRRLVVEEDLSEVDETPLATDHNVPEYDATTNAFDVMKKARKKHKSETESFDKKRSEAKGMVEEQAQESEDEYAGIGGASDDESGGEEDEFVREMIDQGDVTVNERELAAHYADNERARDEKDIAKLYKDINSGMLRRKRGAEFDLSDSDDDAEARQRRKRREFAKMRKALLENENVGKIAEDPKKLAFLRAIEDREDENDPDFLDGPAEDSFRVEADTQEDPEPQSQPTLPEPALGKRKRPLHESVPDKGNMRPPAAARRTQAPKKPATLAEIRESVSFLIEEPGSINIAPDPSSSASEDEFNPQDRNRQNPRRRPNPNSIIDRISLKRAESATSSSTSRLAFHDPSTTNPSIGGFKVPSLLRRATTTNLAVDNHGITTMATAATERAAGGGEKGDFVRRGGTKKSSVNYFAREMEKNKAIEGVERRRKEEREREAKGRKMKLGGLGTGAFE